MLSSPCRRTAASTVAALLLLLAILPSGTMAFDCTPISTVPNDGTTIFGQVGVSALPGEPLCGFDYTGWQLHVYEFTLPQDALQVLFMAVGGGGSSTHLLVFNQCDPNTCVYSGAPTGSGMSLIEEQVCLAAGTYTAVVASQAAVNTVYNVATAPVDVCTPVANGEASWGTLKATY